MAEIGTRVVLGSSSPRAIGEIVIGVYDFTGALQPQQPVMIIKEATRQDWLDYNAANGLEHPRAAQGAAWFYEVSTD